MAQLLYNGGSLPPPHALGQPEGSIKLPLIKNNQQSVPRTPPVEPQQVLESKEKTETKKPALAVDFTRAFQEPQERSRRTMSIGGLLNDK